MLQNAQNQVLSSRDLGSFPTLVPCVISSQCLIFEPPRLPPAIVFCFSFPSIYFLIC